MPATIKVDSQKMTHQVRYLYELSLVKNLSPTKLAPILLVSAMQIYRWYAGNVPKRGTEQLIKIGCEKIEREFPDFLEEGKATWGRLWIDDEDPAEKKREAAEKKFNAQMRRLFDQIQRKATPSEIELLAQELPAWTGLEEMLFLLKKHGIKLPK